MSSEPFPDCLTVKHPRSWAILSIQDDTGDHQPILLETLQGIFYAMLSHTRPLMIMLGAKGDSRGTKLRSLLIAGRQAQHYVNKIGK